MLRITSIKGLIAAILIFGMSIASAQVQGFDHSHKLYDTVLKQFVKNGLVDYSGLKSNPKDLSLYLYETAAVSENDFKNGRKSNS